MSVHFQFSNTLYTRDVVLRNPEFGNSDQLDHFVVNQETIGLDRIMYRDPLWPITTTFNLIFKSLTDQQKEAILEFLFITTGASIFYVDHEARTWNGVILNPEAEAIQEHNCSWSISINFLGIPFDVG